MSESCACNDDGYHHLPGCRVVTGLVSDRRTICPHPSYHNVCDACVREDRELGAGKGKYRP